MIFTIAGKDLKSLFASPVAWVMLTFVQAAVGYSFLMNFNEFLQLQPRLIQLSSPPGFTELVAMPTFLAARGILLLAVPLFAMRLFAEERRNQTLVLLTSAPVSTLDIVLGKFCALLVFMLLIFGLVALMPLSLAGATKLDYALIASILLGLMLLSAAFSAVSLYVSCLVTQPIIAALGAFAAIVAMLLIGDSVVANLDAKGLSVLAALVQVFTPIRNYEPLGRGLIDLHAVTCLTLLTALFITLTVRQLEARRLRG